MLTVTKLKGAEYLIRSVADGMEDYFMGIGEAPGVWRGRWAAELGLEGVVAAEDLRALVDGHDPRSGEDWLAGHRERKVRAIDATLSAPKSVSVLWALGTPETSAQVSLAVVEATEVALGFLEERAALAREQVNGRRRRVGTQGFAVATFAHRTSRAGDPQLHTHCLVPNVVRRADGDHVAFDAFPLHVWSKATGTVFANHLQRLLTERLGVTWGPERNGCREMVGFSAAQLRAFSKRTTAIETRLEAAGEVAYDSKAERMRADDRASLATREAKDPALTPEALRQRWAAEAAAVGLCPGAVVDDVVVGRQLEQHAPPAEAEVFAALVDARTGLCATESRFCEAHVVERVAALSAGRLGTEDIVATAKRFLVSDLVVRLAPDLDRRRPPEWSTVELRAVEDHLLARLTVLTARNAHAVAPEVVEAAIAAEDKALGEDQVRAVGMLCGAGSSVRALVAPAGYGKTTALHAAVTAAGQDRRRVVVVAPTHKAVAELRAVGLEAQTVARFLRNLAHVPLADGATVIVDETSQLATRHAAALVDAVACTPGAQVWFVGDARQAQSVAAGGLAVELERLAEGGAIASATLEVNRRQQHPGERKALACYRAGEVAESQAIRTDHGWEHEAPTPADARHALAAAAVRDAQRHGAEQVAVLAVSHADCEDLADCIRAIRAARGELRGPTLAGPAWGPEPRTYAAGDRILVHANAGAGTDRQVFNGATATVMAVSGAGMAVLIDGAAQVDLGAAFVAGCRPDGTPNLSHAWARTVDGAQGGTWRQVHLLGTPALDRYRGYVGQSRGQLPTHTWNTRADFDHPASLVADQRSPAEAVLDALRRDEPKTLAAPHDPWVLDRRLRAEREEHAAVMARRPPDLRAQLPRAREALEGAAHDHDAAEAEAVRSQDHRARLGPLTRLRRGGGDHIARADEAVAQAHRRRERAQESLQTARRTEAGLERAAAALQAWDRAEGWRLARMAEIDDVLAHHWAEVVLGAARADDPLAFGVERLRAARATYAWDLERLLGKIPPDRRGALARAEADLHRQEETLRHAQRRLRQGRDGLDRAGERHWGRRDRAAVERAQANLAVAERDRQRCADAVAQAHQRVGTEGDAVRRWDSAMEETAWEQMRLHTAVADLDDALGATRAGRVAAAACDPTSDLQLSLGRPPHTGGGLAAWCGIAERVEAWRDHTATPTGRAEPCFGGAHHPVLGPRPPRGAGQSWDRLVALVDHAEELVAAASRAHPVPTGDERPHHREWEPAVEAAARAVAAERSVPAAEQSTGLSLGL